MSWALSFKTLSAVVWQRWSDYPKCYKWLSILPLLMMTLYGWVCSCLLACSGSCHENSEKMKEKADQKGKAFISVRKPDGTVDEKVEDQGKSYRCMHIFMKIWGFLLSVIGFVVYLYGIGAILLSFVWVYCHVFSDGPAIGMFQLKSVDSLPVYEYIDENSKVITSRTKGQPFQVFCNIQSIGWMKVTGGYLVSAGVEEVKDSQPEVKVTVKTTQVAPN